MNVIASIFNKRTIYSSLFFILVVNLIFLSKPSVFFDKNNNVIPFGVGPGKTIFSIGHVVFILAFISYYFFTLIDILFENKNTVKNIIEDSVQQSMNNFQTPMNNMNNMNNMNFQTPMNNMNNMNNTTSMNSTSFQTPLNNMNSTSFQTPANMNNFQYR